MPDIDIREAVQEYRDGGHDESTWISIPQQGYPHGIDVQIEVDDDELSPDYGQLVAWVYPNTMYTTSEGEEYLTTDTQTCLARIPHGDWPA